MRRPVWALTIATASLSLFIKLFTYEYVLRDDPTTGIALRSAPGFDNGPKVLIGGDRVLVADEGGFVGEELYRLFATFAWSLPVALVPLAIWFSSTRKRNRRRPE